MKPTGQNRDTKIVSDNQYLALKALIASPLYGYAIRQEIIEMTQGEAKLSLATLYDVLHRLLDDGFIEQAKDDWASGRFEKVPGDDEFIPLLEN